MTGNELYKRVCGGWHPTVRFAEPVCDSNSQYEVGMMGVLVGAEMDSLDVVKFTIAEGSYAEFNKTMEQPVWYAPNDDLVTKSQLGGRKPSDVVYEDMEMEIGNFEIVDKDSDILFKEYMDSKTNISYIKWLETNLLNYRKE